MGILEVRYIEVNNSYTSALLCKVRCNVFSTDFGNEGGAGNKIGGGRPVSKEKPGPFLIRPRLPTHCPLPEHLDTGDTHCSFEKHRKNCETALIKV